MRIELTCAAPELDGRGARMIRKMAAASGCALRKAAVLDVYLINGLEGFTPSVAADVFLDPVAQRMYLDEPGAPRILPDWNILIEVTYRAGVANPEAHTAREAVSRALTREWEPSAIVQTARQYAFVSENEPSSCAQKIAVLLYNPLIERARIILRTVRQGFIDIAASYPHHVRVSQ